jgi:hypothetical protein
MHRRTRRLVVSALLAASAAWAAPGSAGSQGAVTRTSRPVRLLRSWSETVKAFGRDYPRRVEVLFDYAKGVARENSYDSYGLLRSSRTMTQNMPAPSPEEIAEAFGIARRDPSLAPLFARFSVVTEGGFLLQEEEGMPCGPRTRCLHVFLLSSDRSGLIRRLVVDLVTRSIPYPVYMPSPVGNGER